ncbi:MAG: hypothetical protein ABR499_19115 [Gemmatimonadaceae bacterium]
MCVCVLSLRRTPAVLAIVGAAFITDVAAAQETAPARVSAPTAAWRVGITGGMLAQLSDVAEAGPALTGEVSRRLGASSVSLVGLVIAAQESDVGISGPDRYIYDRDWLIAALGFEAAVSDTARLGFAFGIHGGIQWSRGRRVGQVGTPPPDPTIGGSSWDEGAALIPSLRVTYRVNGPFALSGRTAIVQHVFTDDMFGEARGLVTVGAAFAW